MHTGTHCFSHSLHTYWPVWGSMTVQMTTELLLMATAFQYIRICAGKMVCSLPTLLPPHWAPAVWLQCVKRSRTVSSLLSSLKKQREINNKNASGSFQLVDKCYGKSLHYNAFVQCSVCSSEQRREKVHFKQVTQLSYIRSNNFQ